MNETELRCPDDKCKGRLNFIAISDPVEWAKPPIPARAMYVCLLCKIVVYYAIPDADEN